MAMEGTMADWRLFGDHERLREAKLWWRIYAPRNEIWAQDQCAFCWTTFATSGEDAWHEGYATQPPHGVAEEEEVAPQVEDDEYVTAVIAAVTGAPKSAEPPAPPEPEPEPEPDIAASLLEAIQLPSTAVEAPQSEPVQWICPQCFEDFKDYFGWQVKNAD